MALVGCALEPNPSPHDEPTVDGGWSDAADAMDGTDGDWPGSDGHDGGDSGGEADGSDTTDGSIDGADGVDGADAADGSDMLDGVDATDATDATDGNDAVDATDATDGNDASDATDGSDGNDASDATDGSDSDDATDGSDSDDATDSTDGACPVPPSPGPLAQAPADLVVILENMDLPAVGDLPEACLPFFGSWSVNKHVEAFRAAGGQTRVVGPETGFGRIATVSRPMTQSRTYAVTSAVSACSESLIAEAPEGGREFIASIHGSAEPCDYGLVDTYPGGGLWQPPMTLNQGPPVLGFLDEAAAEGVQELPVLRRLEFFAAYLVRNDEQGWLCGIMKPDQLDELAYLLCPDDSQFCAPWIEASYCNGLSCNVALSFDVTIADRLVLEGSP